MSTFALAPVQGSHSTMSAKGKKATSLERLLLATAGVRLPLPFTTRMTVVRLGNDDLFIHSPIAFEPALADRLQAMGTVRHLVSPNQFHYAHIGEWSRAFPGAVAFASPRARKRARSRGIDVHFDRDIGIEPPEEWRAEVDQTAVPGGIFGEIVFFHKESKTLILADTISRQPAPQSLTLRSVGDRPAGRRPSQWRSLLQFLRVVLAFLVRAGGLARAGRQQALLTSAATKLQSSGWPSQQSF